MNIAFTNNDKMEDVDFNNLVKTYSFPLYLYAKKKMHDNIDAEDIVQDCLLRLWEKRNKIGNIQSMKSFLYTVVRNECINRLKRNNTLNYIECIDPDSLTENETISDIDEFDIITTVMEAIDTLPPQYSKVMKLTAKGMKNSEIATELNIAKNSVKVMKTRSFKKIKELFGGEILLIILTFIQ